MVMMTTMKLIPMNFCPTQPANSEMYEQMFVDQTVLKIILSKYFVEEQKMMAKAVKWMNTDDSFGKAERLRVSGEQIRGRWLWMLKEHYHVPINLKAACERHVEEEADVVTIGYTRKSYGYESMTTHARLIQSQVDSLRGRYLARKVSVSSRCNASIPLEDRGKKQGDSMVKIGQIENCAGTMQDLIHRLCTNMKAVRIVVMDYTSLSADFEEVHIFVSKYKQIVELVVDVEYSFDIISRADILNDNNVSKKFNCRIGPRKRGSSSVEDYSFVCFPFL
ncbi:hypothetical protein CU097_003758 [Rhizopus azygosporus]|uniref:Uncharacterized protein n=1 Tax=Rhizopus azygosporus TaxID=86630 RepID=A0A367J502_RHIAZ|nr:hypothetical protein CU097_003758 [Rhizopus azygosporus]